MPGPASAWGIPAKATRRPQIHRLNSGASGKSWHSCVSGTSGILRLSSFGKIGPRLCAQDQTVSHMPSTDISPAPVATRHFRFAWFAFLIPFCFLLLPCSLLRAAEPFRYREATHGAAELEYRNGFPVLTVAGTPQEMGEPIAVFTAHPIQ